LFLASLGLAALLVVAPRPGSAQTAEITKPDCAALEDWAAGVDGEDHWLPLEGYRGWLPRAFQEPAFAQLFGVPALEWQVEDANEMAAHVFACAKQAANERRIDVRDALYAARGYLTSNLRGVLGRQKTMAARAEREAQREAKQAERRKERAAQERARAEARQQERDAIIDEALAAVLDQPASPELLRTLAVLQEVNLNDRRNFEQAERRVDQAARMLMIRLMQQGRDLKDPRVASTSGSRRSAGSWPECSGGRPPPNCWRRWRPSVLPSSKGSSRAPGS
jgi:hypothetical protein